MDSEHDGSAAEVLRSLPRRLLRAAWQVRERHHPPGIRFDRPTATLPVSLTGTRCALQCAHCAGYYLRHMRPIGEVSDPPARSLLVSGGCDAQGRVPVDGHLLHVSRLRRGRRLNWHVGLIDEPTMLRIAPYVDLISFDVVGDRRTAEEVYGLPVSLSDYVAAFEMLRRHARVVPHLTLGLRGGQFSGEHAALEALATRAVDALVLLVLIPTPGTRYEHCRPPAVEEVAEFLARARTTLPEARLYLGCMRPKGAYRDSLDVAAVRAGLNVIVNPARTAVATAERLGLRVEWGDECCALD